MFAKDIHIDDLALTTVNAELRRTRGLKYSFILERVRKSPLIEVHAILNGCALGDGGVGIYANPSKPFPTVGEKVDPEGYADYGIPPGQIKGLMEDSYGHYGIFCRF